MHIVALVASPGAGKEFQWRRICKTFGLNSKLQVMTMSSVLNDMLSQNPDVANQMASGALISNDLVADCFYARMDKYQSESVETVILDGFPRTYEQVKILWNFYMSKQSLSVHILDFRVPDHVCEPRLRGRFKEIGRLDDTPEIACRRLALYYANYHGLKIGDTIIQAMKPELQKFGSYHSVVWNGGHDDLHAKREFNEMIDKILISCGAVKGSSLFESSVAPK